MRFTAKLWKSLELDVKDRLEVVEPLRYHSLASIKNKRERHKLAAQLGGPDIYLPANIDVEQLNLFQDNAVAIGRSLLRDIKKKSADGDFIFGLAEFCYACGFIVSASSTWKVDEGKMRAAYEGGLRKKAIADEKKIWVSRELMGLLDTGMRRNLAEIAIARAVKAAISTKSLPKGLGRAWLQSLLAPDNRSLRDSYCQKRLPRFLTARFAGMQIDIPRLPLVST